MVKDQITRREFIRSATAAAVTGCAGLSLTARGVSSIQKQASESVRNVLFIVVDDLNNALGCYGHPVVQSPNIDGLASKGVRFESAYCQFPVCNPSRSSFLTGLYPETTGILDNRMPLFSRHPDAITLPHWFRQHGYFTAGIGKIFHGSGQMDDPEAFDVILHPRGTAAGRKGQGRNLTGGQVKWCRWLAAEGEDEDQPDGQMAEEAIKLLKEKRDKPFFMAIGFHKPHDPFIAPKRYFDLYSLERLTPPMDPSDRTPDLPMAIASGWKKAFDLFTDQERREFMRAYFAGTSFIDAQLGKVLDALERLRFMDNTIIVFFSDHGYHLGHRGWWNKNTLFELSCRIPLIVATPDMKANGVSGRACSGIVECLDFFPTLTDLCGLPDPDGFQGISFRPLLRNPALSGKKTALTVVKRGESLGRSIRTQRWRYTEWDQGRLGVELYDHRVDPGEYYNLAGNPKYADTLSELKGLLK